MRDDNEAARWYQKAAEQGHAVAQYNLGNRFASGRGVPQNNAEAMEWYRMAAEQGYNKAQSKLDMLRNDIEAAGRYLNAAKKGDSEAQFRLVVSARQKIPSIQ